MSALIHTTITETCCARPEAGQAFQWRSWRGERRLDRRDLDRRSTRAGSRNSGAHRGKSKARCAPAAQQSEDGTCAQAAPAGIGQSAGVWEILARHAEGNGGPGRLGAALVYNGAAAHLGLTNSFSPPARPAAT